MKLSLYVHIPFCAEKCDYCDFFSVPLKSVDSGSLLPGYFTAVVEEILRKLEFIENPELVSIFLGGGTPSVVPVGIFENFLSQLSLELSPILSRDIEFTSEANIESCSREFIETAEAFGINRLSIGVQSFNPNALRQLGRAVFPDRLIERVENIKSGWNGRLSLDLISGAEPDFIRDIGIALRIDPGHLSVYQLTVEEGTALHTQISEGTKKAPDEAIQAEALASVNRLLPAEGYRRYEISNFCRPGNECRHNLRYWNMQSYIGAGASAVSSFYLDSGKFRMTNTADIGSYLKNTAAETEKLSDFDFMLEHYIMGCRLTDGINTEIFSERFGRLPHEFIPDTSARWIADGCMNEDDFRLNEAGLMLLDSFLSDVYRELEEKYKK